MAEMKWVPNIRQIAKEMHERGFTGLTPGHRLCAGCVAGTIVRQVMMAARKPVVVINATGCLEVATTIFPYTAWQVPWAHNAFENAAAVASGVERAQKKLIRDRRFEGDPDIEMDYDIVVFGGDGGTYDIGLQALSGALERGHKFMYVLYDNEAYMNTGIQRSGSTPFGAWTTTTPAGKVILGKQVGKKPLVDIIAAHRIPYVATVSPYYWNDALVKFRRGFEADGPVFIRAFSTCNRGWYNAPEESIAISKLAVETCVFPLYEVINGVEWRLSPPSLAIAKNPEKKKPVEEYLKTQRRFRHMFEPENRWMIKRFQEMVDYEWELLLERVGLKG